MTESLTEQFPLHHVIGLDTIPRICYLNSYHDPFQCPGIKIVKTQMRGSQGVRFPCLCNHVQTVIAVRA